MELITNSCVNFAHSELGSGCTRLRSHLIVGDSDSVATKAHDICRMSTLTIVRVAV